MGPIIKEKEKIIIIIKNKTNQKICSHFFILERCRGEVLVFFFYSFKSYFSDSRVSNRQNSSG